MVHICTKFVLLQLTQKTILILQKVALMTRVDEPDLAHGHVFKEICIEMSKKYFEFLYP